MYAVIVTSMRAGTSSAIMFSLSSCNVLTTSIAFFLIFGERLHLKHYLAMSLMLIGILTLAVSKETNNSKSLSTRNHNEQLSVLYPITFALLGCLLFTASSLVARGA